MKRNSNLPFLLVDLAAICLVLVACACVGYVHDGAFSSSNPGTAGSSSNPGTAGSSSNPGTAGSSNPGTAGSSNPGTGGSSSNPGTAGSMTVVTCGNGKLDSGESCEGSNLNGSTCSSLGFTGGTLACAASCLFDTTACSGPLTLTVTPSRTSCTAPCAVFFDATGTTGLMNSDYVNANFSWDFDSTGVNPTGAHRRTVGFVVGHVFDAPGTYQVSVLGRDMGGRAG